MIKRDLFSWICSLLSPTRVVLESPVKRPGIFAHSIFFLPLDCNSGCVHSSDCTGVHPASSRESWGADRTVPEPAAEVALSSPCSTATGQGPNRAGGKSVGRKGGMAPRTLTRGCFEAHLEGVGVSRWVP